MVLSIIRRMILVWNMFVIFLNVRNNRYRLSVSYKITKEQVKYAMSELAKMVKKKYDDFDITPRKLRNVIKDNNITRKWTIHEHFTVMRYGTPIEKQKELNTFYKKVDEYKKLLVRRNLYKTSNVVRI